MNIQVKVFRSLVYFFGDLRRIKSFPWVTWDVSEHKIDFNEIVQEALPKLNAGDVILHRDDGFASNLFIGGAMIHAGLYVGDGQVIEATSEGVLKRSAIHILHSDRAIILRPKLSQQQKEAACKDAAVIVGFPYDFLFTFCDGEDRRKILTEKKKERFCCTEIPHFVFMPYNLHINMRRNMTLLTRLLNLCGLHPGQTVIDADMYVTADFEVIWKSRRFTSAWAGKMRCMPDYVAKLKKFETSQLRPLSEAGQLPEPVPGRGAGRTEMARVEG